MDYRLPIKGLGFALLDFAEKASPVSGAGPLRQANNAEAMLAVIDNVLREMETVVRELTLAVYEEAEVTGWPYGDIGFVEAYFHDIKGEIHGPVEQAVEMLRAGAREAAE